MKSEEEIIEQVQKELRKGLEKIIGEPDENLENIKNIIEKSLKSICKTKIFPRYKILSCEQDPEDPNKITIIFEWLEV